MRYLILFIFMTCSFTLLGGVAACSPEEAGQTIPPLPTDNNEENDNENDSGNPIDPNLPGNMKVEIRISGKSFTATLKNNATAAAFREKLPLTINMSEHNYNEKYYNFTGSLPTAAIRPGTIHNGDIMLYGNNCLVLFYKTFTSSYSYTPIGSIDNPDGLERAVGTGNITITWSEIK